MGMTPKPLNWALGVEYAFSPLVSGYVSYYTDNSTLTDEVERAGLGILPFDISNVTVGSDFVVRTVRFTLGLGWPERIHSTGGIQCWPGYRGWPKLLHW